MDYPVLEPCLELPMTALTGTRGLSALRLSGVNQTYSEYSAISKGVQAMPVEQIADVTGKSKEGGQRSQFDDEVRFCEPFYIN